jgi:UDP-N-acetyl-D-glucosamine dehydrogenase
MEMDRSGAEALLQGRLADGSARVGIIGLGYVGLPLAVGLARSGLTVVGHDLDAGKVEEIGAGRSYILDVPGEELAAQVAAGRLSATAQTGFLGVMDVVVICVPTPLSKTRDPDISFILRAVEAIKPHVREGQLIILESTSYPGTTREILQKELEAGGLRAGRDIFIVFSPERIDPANREFSLENTPKIVGGVTPACARLASLLYGRINPRVVTVSSADSAEMVKLLENTFRAVNIALVNELAIMCRRLGLDVWEIIEAAATKPFGFMPFRPGPGLGGHCIPVDPYYLSWKLRSLKYTARFVELAGEINSHMPGYVADLVADALNGRGLAVNGARILLLGVTYKRDVADLRESPALDVAALLLARGARLSYHDPLVTALGSEWSALERVEFAPESFREKDCVVVLTDHSWYDWPAVHRWSSLVVDTRNALGAAGIRDPERIVTL